MARYRCWDGPPFLEYVNNRITYASTDGAIRIRTAPEKDARDSGLSSAGDLVFTQPVDAVIKGYCLLEEDPQDRACLYERIERLSSRCILILATCGELYSAAFQEDMRSRFSGITLLFPDMTALVHDFGSDEGIVEAVQCLLAAGIIAPTDNDS